MLPLSHVRSKQTSRDSALGSGLQFPLRSSRWKTPEAAWAVRFRPVAADLLDLSGVAICRAGKGVFWACRQFIDGLTLDRIKALVFGIQLA